MHTRTQTYTYAPTEKRADDTSCQFYAIELDGMPEATER